MKTQTDFLYNAKLIVAGLGRGMYDEKSVAFYLYEAYKKGVEDAKDDEGDRQHHATYSYKGVF